MIKIEKIIELGNQLPRGAKVKISNKCGVSRALVVQFFKGSKLPSSRTMKKVLNATSEVIEEYRNESNNINTIVDKLKLQ